MRAVTAARKLSNSMPLGLGRRFLSVFAPASVMDYPHFSALLFAMHRSHSFTSCFAGHGEKGLQLGSFSLPHQRMILHCGGRCSPRPNFAQSAGMRASSGRPILWLVLFSSYKLQKTSSSGSQVTPRMSTLTASDCIGASQVKRQVILRSKSMGRLRGGLTGPSLRCSADSGLRRVRAKTAADLGNWF